MKLKLHLKILIFKNGLYTTQKGTVRPDVDKNNNKELSVPHRKHSAQQFKCQAVKNVYINYGPLLTELNKRSLHASHADLAI